MCNMHMFMFMFMFMSCHVNMFNMFNMFNMHMHMCNRSVHVHV